LKCGSEEVNDVVVEILRKRELKPVKKIVVVVVAW
jgi:hypothetical protein